MKTELQQKLFEKYPKIFADRHKSMMETCMVWGLECGPGWENIRAIRMQRVCYFKSEESELLGRPGPRMAEAAGIIAKCLIDKSERSKAEPIDKAKVQP